MARDTEHNFTAIHAIDEKMTNLDLHLQPGLTLSVKVQDVNGKPMPSATGAVFIEPGDTLIQFSSKADDLGRIETKGLPQERQYWVLVTAKGYRPAHLQAEIGDTRTNHFSFPTVVLRAADRKLAGQVLGPDGKPAPETNVALKGNDQPEGCRREFKRRLLREFKRRQ
jgi:hypothetical protein